MVTSAPDQTGAAMTLDEALAALRQDMTDAPSQSKFYDIFLNTTFCVPTLDPQELEGEVEVAAGEVLPLVIAAEGNDYLMIFDTRERMTGWAHAEVPCVEMAGHHLAAISLPPLQWALNAGTDHSKLFLSEEIAWLKQMAGGLSGGTCGCAGR